MRTARRSEGAAVAGHPSAAFEPVDDAGHGGGMQPGASCEGARAERAVPVDEIKAVQIDVLEINARADVMVKQGQLDAQLAQRLLDRGTQPPSAPRRAGVLRYY
jgi:hypothetical protein